jgi:hypothetical protein
MDWEDQADRSVAKLFAWIAVGWLIFFGFVTLFITSQRWGV